MKREPKKSFIPIDRQETIRQKIIAVLKESALTARDISGEVGVSEKEVYEHLSHIQKSVNKKGRKLIVSPANCRKCGFSFRKREKLRKPGKCPICRNESIEETLFSIT